MPFKVCSCPKRDMQRDDTSKESSRKRELKLAPHAKRPSKIACVTEIKQEHPSPSPQKTNEEVFIDSPHTVTLTMPNKNAMEHVLRCAYNEITGVMSRDKSKNYQVYADKVQNLLHSL